MAGRPTLALSSFLPYRLSVVAAVVSQGLARTYSERFGISIPEWRVLATVAEFRSTTAKAVGLHARMNKVMVSRAAAALEARDLIRKTPNPHDLREGHLVLTPAGQSLYSEVAPLALDYVRQLTDGLSAAELADIDHLINKLMRRAEEMEAAAP